METAPSRNASALTHSSYSPRRTRHVTPKPRNRRREGPGPTAHPPFGSAPAPRTRVVHTRTTTHFLSIVISMEFCDNEAYAANRRRSLERQHSAHAYVCFLIEEVQVYVGVQ